MLNERLENYKLEVPGNFDLDYLTTHEIGGIITRGLGELYMTNPKNPITFLAQWLMNECKSQEIDNKIKAQNERREELNEQFKLKQEIEIAKKDKLEEEMKKWITDREKFIEYINKADYMEDILDTVCTTLQKQVNATGVYISSNSKKRVLIDAIDAGDKDHLLDYDVLRYVYYSEDHAALLKHKCIEPEAGVTFDIFLQKSDEGNANPEGGENANQRLDTNNSQSESQMQKEQELKSILIPEVIRDKRIKFLREPRLGCYLAIDITYKSSFSKNSLDSAIECIKEYESRILAKHDLDKLKELEKEEARKLAENNIEENDEVEKKKEITAEVVEEEKIILREFDVSDKKFVFSLDTMGQDRVFDEEEHKWIMKVAISIKNGWEKLERKLIIKDRDLRIEMFNLDMKIRELQPNDKMNEEEERYIKEHIAEITNNSSKALDEEQKRIEMEYSKSKYIFQLILNDEDFLRLFDIMAQLEFVEYEKAFQIIYYFININNTEINEEHTNALSWRKSRHFWKRSVIEKIQEYDPFGPKSKPASEYFMLNKLLKEVSEFSQKIEMLREYNLTVGKLIDAIVILLNVRRDDITKRKVMKQELMDQRNQKMKEKEDREEKRENDLRAARENAASMDPPEEFNEEEFFEKFDIEFEEIIIPDEVEFDIDEDYVVVEQ